MYAKVDELYRASSLIHDLDRALMNFDIIEAMNISYQLDEIIAAIINRDTASMKNADFKKREFVPYIDDDDELAFDFKKVR